MLGNLLARSLYGKSLARSVGALRVPTMSAGSKLSQVKFYSKFENQPRLRLGSIAPNFQADTTSGKLDFHNYIGDNWMLFFSHPADFTPVCTTELGAFASLQPEFNKRGVKLIGLSTDGVESHNKWIKDIEDVTSCGSKVGYPVIDDASKEVSFLYDMVTEEDFGKISSGPVSTVRSVFIIDPLKKVRLIMTYPASTGRNTAEILRVIDALQLSDSKGVVTPVDWTAGADVIIPPPVSNEAAKEKFGDFKTLKPYLRTTKIN